ncbi:MAG TPA: hypothetical protein EYH05_20670 [Anaerolineae bacterium]|nr:hypothetical protein [Anaerolineae bacterium]
MSTQTNFNYLFVSDLHLSEGRDPQTGLIHRNEDFFEDNAFAQFVAYHAALSRNPEASAYYQKPWKLVINGDIFDFLQVVSLPAEGDELVKVTGASRYKDLSANVCKFGLGTQSKEIVWKLNRIAAGHPLFFQALAWFLAQEGKELVCMKGNHDIELYWPAVQHRMKTLLTEAYREWYNHHDTECPLPVYDDMPAELDPNILRTAVHFPPFHLYEPDLFYAEHGCQYDPANAFANFDDPRLPDKPELLELPSGSLFVRYFFNRVESIHPFADNLKPISRYIFWLLQNAPAEIVNIAANILPDYLFAWWETRQKTKKKTKPQAPNEPFRQELLKIHLESQKMLGKASRKTTLFMSGSGILLFTAVFLFFILIRAAGAGQYVLGAVLLLLILITLAGSLTLFHSLNKLLTEPYLYTAAQNVARLLKKQPDMRDARYLIFGHDHAAKMWKIPPQEGDGAPNYRQWYVNTGSWIPVFSEEERLERPSAHLTFFRLVPEHIQDNAPHGDVPELLRWSPEAGRPLPARLFSGEEKRNCDT